MIHIQALSIRRKKPDAGNPAANPVIIRLDNLTQAFDTDPLSTKKWFADLSVGLDKENIHPGFGGSPRRSQSGRTSTDDDYIIL
jgi:hypothetical protein